MSKYHQSPWGNSVYCAECTYFGPPEKPNPAKCAKCKADFPPLPAHFRAYESLPFNLARRRAKALVQREAAK